MTLVSASLLDCVADTLDSFLILGLKKKARDCYILSRTAFETMVNIAFICAQGEKAADRAISHAKQKGYRDRHRELEAGGMKISVKAASEIDTRLLQEVQNDLQQFTNKKGREITSWTPENTKQQIDEIFKHFGNKVAGGFSFGLLGTYRHASEILHGTFFGALYAMGIADYPVVKIPPRDAIRKEHIYSQIVMLCMSATSLILALSKRWPALADYYEQSAKIISRLAMEPWVHDKPNG